MGSPTDRDLDPRCCCPSTLMTSPHKHMSLGQEAPGRHTTAGDPWVLPAQGHGYPHHHTGHPAPSRGPGHPILGGTDAGDVPSSPCPPLSPAAHRHRAKATTGGSTESWAPPPCTSPAPGAASGHLHVTMVTYHCTRKVILATMKRSVHTVFKSLTCCEDPCGHPWEGTASPEPHVRTASCLSCTFQNARCDLSPRR